jgi:hypothetical protein
MTCWCAVTTTCSCHVQAVKKGQRPRATLPPLADHELVGCVVCHIVWVICKCSHLCGCGPCHQVSHGFGQGLCGGQGNDSSRVLGTAHLRMEHHITAQHSTARATACLATDCRLQCDAGKGLRENNAARMQQGSLLRGMHRHGNCSQRYCYTIKTLKMCSCTDTHVSPIVSPHLFVHQVVLEAHKCIHELHRHPCGQCAQQVTLPMPAAVRHPWSYDGGLQQHGIAQHSTAQQRMAVNGSVRAI